MEVLEFYTDQTKRNEAEYGTASLVPSSLPLIPSDSEGDRWANLMPRQQPTPPSSRPERPQRPERPDRPEDQLRPSIPERSQSVDTLPVTQRMSSLGIYDDRVSSLFLALSSLTDSVNVKKGSFFHVLDWMVSSESTTGSALSLTSPFVISLTPFSHINC